MFDNPEVLAALVSGIFDIFARHKASGATEPLTREQVQEQLTADLNNGESIIAQEFARLGLTPPQ
jgi:hypothetical protein